MIRGLPGKTPSCLLILCLGFATTVVGAEDLTSDELAVWELEESYYRFAKNNDPESYLSLFHDDVIGWPTHDPAPKGRNKVSQWIGAVHSDPAKDWNYEIERLAIQSFGDVVVVHYRLRDYFVSTESGEEINSQEFRISHSWLRVGETWQIISGMGARFD